jgi:hypothetical protein
MEKLVWTNEETFKAAIEVSHFAQKPLPNATIEWAITDASNKTLAEGKTEKNLPVDNCIAVSEIEFPLSAVEEPSRLTRSVKVSEADAVNRWHIWVYPAKETISGNKPYFTMNYSDAAAKAKAGGNVLYCLPKDALKPEKGGNIAVGFSSIFWNTAWTGKQAPHTLGIYCDPAHPALSAFPNEGCSDYQWWDVVAHCSAMNMDDFPADFRPLIHLIDDWFTNRKLGILFETKAGAGKMMVCSADIVSDLDNRPAARQFRRSIEQYMISDKFNPAVEIDMNTIRELLK